MMFDTVAGGPLRLLGWLAAGAVIALIALMLYVGDPYSAEWWLRAIPFGLWITGPAIVPWVVARWRRSPIVTALMLGFLVLSSALSAVLYYQAFFLSTSSTSALIFIFAPLLQWAVLVLVIIIALAASAFVQRRSA